jgi:hypothetical protein
MKKSPDLSTGAEVCPIVFHEQATDRLSWSSNYEVNETEKAEITDGDLSLMKINCLPEGKCLPFNSSQFAQWHRNAVNTIEKIFWVPRSSHTLPVLYQSIYRIILLLNRRSPWSASPRQRVP